MPVDVETLIRSVELLITSNGYPAEREIDVLIRTHFETRNYRNDAGEKLLEVYLAYDRGTDHLVIEALDAIKYKTAPHRDTLLECLAVAMAAAPGIRHVLDPADGSLQLRIDVPCSNGGPRSEDVLDALVILPWFVDSWWPQILSAGNHGMYDANAVSRYHRPALLVAAPKAETTPQPPVARAPVKKPPLAAQPPSDFAARAVRIAQSPGASAPRLLALRAFHCWLTDMRANGKPFCAGDEPADPPAVSGPEAQDGGPETDKPDTQPPMNPHPKETDSDRRDRKRHDEEHHDGHDD